MAFQTGTQSNHRMSPAEGRALVQAWRDSGQSIAEFSRRDRAAMQRLSYWKRRSEGGAEDRKPGFVMMKVADDVPRESCSAGMFEIQVGDQVIIRFAADTYSLADVLHAACEVVS